MVQTTTTTTTTPTTRPQQPPSTIPRSSTRTLITRHASSMPNLSRTQTHQINKMSSSKLKTSSSTSTSNPASSHQHRSHSSSCSSTSSSNSANSTSSSNSSQRQYYLISNLPSTQLVSTETATIDAWQEPYIIEDEDLMFDGTPLNELYEMNRLQEEQELRSRRSSGESERSLVWKEEMRRGRRRDRK